MCSFANIIISFYSLVVTPEYIHELREEILQALANNEGIMNSKALQEMEKVDSYMKEVFRFYNFGTSTSTESFITFLTHDI